MNKAELIDAVADSADISKAAAARSVDTVIEVITESLNQPRWSTGTNSRLA